MAYTPMYSNSYSYPQFPQPTAAMPYQPTPIRSTINGKVISSLNDITPQDVVMDGTVSIFPLADYSKIYAKAWTADGTIATYSFVPEVIPDEKPKELPAPDKSNDLLDKILQRLDDIEALIK